MQLASYHNCFICACFLLTTETAKPSMLELNRFVVYRHSCKWKNISIELGLEFDIIDEIEAKCNHDNTHCFQRTLNMWLKEKPCPSWNTLEVAITNVNRIESGLEPVASVHGKDMIRYIAVHAAWGNVFTWLNTVP